MSKLKAHEIPFPDDSPVNKTLPKADYEEAFSRTILTLTSDISSQELVDLLILHVPSFMNLVLRCKELALLPLGFSPISFEKFQWLDFGATHRVGIFEDRPFTAHIGVSINHSTKEVVLSNRILLHNSVGRLYFTLIKPIHKLAFKYLLNSI